MPHLDLQSRGARFQRLDFHVHTPASGDSTQYGTSNPDDLVRAALEAGLSGIVIADHNTVDWVERMRAAADGTGLTVLPGVEISTNEGHLLAVFDCAATEQSLREFLVEVGFKGEAYGNLNALAKGGIEQVAQVVIANGGLAIPAHIDKPKGIFTTTAGRRRQQLLADNVFSAFELVDLSRRDEIQRTVGSSRTLIFVRGSDSIDPPQAGHRVSGVGIRHSLIKAGSLSLRSLKHAFNDPEMRVRDTESTIASPAWHLAGIQVAGGFFSGLTAELNEGLACVIGGTGSGKSLLLELIRFALDQQSEVEAVKAEVHSKLAAALTDEATVRVSIEMGGISYEVERSWLNGAPSDPVVRDVSGPGIRILDVLVSELFPLSAFSQGEVIEFARDPAVRMRLIDEGLDQSPLRRRLSSCLRQLDTNADQLIETWEEQSATAQLLATESAVAERKRRLEALFTSDVVRKSETWQRERQQFESADSCLVQLSQQARQGGQTDPLPPLADAENADLVGRVKAVVAAAQESLNKYRSSATTAVEQSKRQLAAIKGEWDKRFDIQQAEEATALADAGGDKASLRTELQRHQASSAEMEAARHRLEAVLNPKAEALVAKREDLLSELAKIRREARDLRKSEIVRLNGRMEGRVRLALTSEGARESFRDSLRNLKVGSRLPDELMDSLAATTHPIPLAKALLGMGPTPDDLDPGVFDRLKANVEQRELLREVFALQVVSLRDTLSVQFALNDQTYREVESLAHGQKCTAMLVIVMAKGDNPVIVDQPEDAVHAPWIEEYLVESLRSQRGMRQFIMATRSPGIVVSADADQIIGLEATSASGRVTCIGSLEDYETIEDVIYHMEGGRIPFGRRSSKYA